MASTVSSSLCKVSMHNVFLFHFTATVMIFKPIDSVQSVENEIGYLTDLDDELQKYELSCFKLAFSAIERTRPHEILAIELFEMKREELVNIFGFSLLDAWRIMQCAKIESGKTGVQESVSEQRVLRKPEAEVHDSFLWRFWFYTCVP